jgi:hypothetical protein
MIPAAIDGIRPFAMPPVALVIPNANANLPGQDRNVALVELLEREFGDAPAEIEMAPQRLLPEEENALYDKRIKGGLAMMAASLTLLFFARSSVSTITSTPFFLSGVHLVTSEPPITSKQLNRKVMATILCTFVSMGISQVDAFGFESIAFAASAINLLAGSVAIACIQNEPITDQDVLI